MELEKRIFVIKDLKLEKQKRDVVDGTALDDDEYAQMRIEGHAAVFNQETDLGWAIEVIEPGFFTEALKRSDPRALFNHNEDFIMGRLSAKTLSVEEDADGLKVNILPPTTELINDMVLVPMGRGDLREMSFMWTTKPDGDKWEDLPGGGRKRTLLKNGCQELYDVSVVTFPAYPTTDATVQAAARRSMERWQEGKKDLAPAVPNLETHTQAHEAEFRSRELQLMETSD